MDGRDFAPVIRAFATLPPAAAPAGIAPPALPGPPRVGEALAGFPGLWSGSPAPVLAREWLRGGVPVPGATLASYTPGPADDLALLALRVTATNPSGSATAVSAALAVTWPPPAAQGTLPDRSWTEGSGVQTVAAAAAFSGAEGGSWSLVAAPAGVTIDQTGTVFVPTATVLGPAAVVVGYTNSGGSAEAGFTVSVAAAGGADFTASDDATLALILASSDTALDGRSIRLLNGSYGTVTITGRSLPNGLTVFGESRSGVIVQKIVCHTFGMTDGIVKLHTMTLAKPGGGLGEFIDADGPSGGTLHLDNLHVSGHVDETSGAWATAFDGSIMHGMKVNHTTRWDRMWVTRCRFERVEQAIQVVADTGIVVAENEGRHIYADFIKLNSSRAGPRSGLGCPSVLIERNIGYDNFSLITDVVQPHSDWLQIFGTGTNPLVQDWTGIVVRNNVCFQRPTARGNGFQGLIASLPGGIFARLDADHNIVDTGGVSNSVDGGLGGSAFTRETRISSKLNGQVTRFAANGGGVVAEALILEKLNDPATGTNCLELGSEGATVAYATVFANWSWAGPAGLADLLVKLTPAGGGGAFAGPSWAADPNRRGCIDEAGRHIGHDGMPVDWSGVYTGGEGSGAPQNLAAPALSGTPAPGQTLAAGTGSWSNAPTAFAFAWQRDQGAGFADLPGAAAASYLVQAADAGSTLRVRVTATNAAGAGIAHSAGLAVSGAGAGALILLSAEAKTSANGTQPLALALTVPAAANRYLVAVVTGYAETGNAAQTVTAALDGVPLVLLATAGEAAGRKAIRVFGLAAPQAGGGTLTVTPAEAHRALHISAHVLGNIDQTTPLDGAAVTADPAADGNAWTIGLAAAGAGAVVLAALAVDQGGQTVTVTGSVASLHAGDSGGGTTFSDVSWCVAAGTMAAAGAASAGFAWGVVDDFCAVMLALRSA